MPKSAKPTLTLKTPLSHPIVQWVVLGGTLASLVFVGRMLLGHKRPHAPRTPHGGHSLVHP